MEDRDEKAGSDPEIEAHGRKGPRIKATDEAKPSESTQEEEADVELHKKKLTK